jgi:thiosulfate dehydrogenase (quinone) large subunit
MILAMEDALQELIDVPDGSGGRRIGGNAMSLRLTNSQGIAGLRIAVGLLFLIFAQYKVFGTEFTLHGGFQYWINLFLKDGAYPFMVGVLKGFVLPHATFVAFLVAYGELAIGIALVTGIWVGPASVFGAIFMITLIFSANYPGPDAPLWRYFGASLEHSVFLLCFVTFALSDSAEVASLARNRTRKQSPRTS